MKLQLAGSLAELRLLIALYGGATAVITVITGARN